MCESQKIIHSQLSQRTFSGHPLLLVDNTYLILLPQRKTGLLGVIQGFDTGIANKAAPYANDPLLVELVFRNKSQDSLAKMKRRTQFVKYKNTNKDTLCLAIVFEKQVGKVHKATQQCEERSIR